VEATATDLVFAELLEQCGSVLGVGDVIENQPRLARREADLRHIVFPAALILVVTRAEANDGAAPHHRFLASGLGDEFGCGLRVGAADIVVDAGDEI